MNDLISRQAVIETVRKCAVKEVTPAYMLIDRAEAMTELMMLPSAQQERQKGEWIERNPQNSDKCRLIECDQCGFAHIVGFNVPYEHWIENRNFCERCGADMRREGER